MAAQSFTTPINNTTRWLCTRLTSYHSIFPSKSTNKVTPPVIELHVEANNFVAWLRKRWATSKSYSPQGEHEGKTNTIYKNDVESRYRAHEVIKGRPSYGSSFCANDTWNPTPKENPITSAVVLELFYRRSTVIYLEMDCTFGKLNIFALIPRFCLNRLTNCLIDRAWHNFGDVHI